MYHFKNSNKNPFRLGELMKSRTKMPETPANQDLSNQKFLSYLLATRELKQFWELGEKMVKAGKGKNKRLLYPQIRKQMGLGTYL